jgi:hypothetical protein
MVIRVVVVCIHTKYIGNEFSMSGMPIREIPIQKIRSYLLANGFFSFLLS